MLKLRNQIDHRRCQVKIGFDDDIGRVQGLGIIEHGRVHAGRKPVQGDEGNDGQGHTQNEYHRLAAGACDLADNEMSMQKSVGHIRQSVRP